MKNFRNILVAFGYDAMSVTRLKEWYRFKDGCTSVCEPRSGRPSTSRFDQVIAKVNAVVLTDRRVTIREIAEELDISTLSAHSILTKYLAIKKETAKFLALDSNRFGETPDTCHSPGSFLP